MSRAIQRLVRDMRLREHIAHTRQTQGVDFHALREFNRLLVLNSIRQRGPITRVAISKRTGLSRTTVSSIVESLLKEGLVREGNMLSAAPSGGRRAILLHFNADAGCIIGVDAGRTHFTVVVTNLAAEVLARHSGPFNADLGPDLCLPQLAAELRALLKRADITWDRVLGVGLAIPGPMDARLRMLVSPPRMPGWDSVDVQAILGRELNVPIYLGNDANLGALGESRYGDGRGVPDMTYIKVGTGIGCGLIINGTLYRGSRGSAGELGHFTIDADGPICDCGNRGCLEAIAGAAAIIRDACEGISLCRIWGDRALSATPPALAGRTNVDAAEVVQAALDGDRASRAAIESAGEHIGTALAGLVNLVNPSIIFIDGGFSHAGELLLGPIRRAIATRSLSVASASVRIAAGTLGDTAIALGAVAVVIDAAFGAPADSSSLLFVGSAAETDDSASFSAHTRVPATEAAALTTPVEASSSL